MRILVVSDDPVGLDDVAAALTGYGDCDAVQGCDKALDHLQKAHEEARPFGLLVLDCAATCEAARGAIAAIRKWEEAKSLGGVRILLVASSADAEAVAAATSCGGNAFLPKPFMPDELKEILAGLGIGVRLSLKPRPPA